MEDLIFEVTLDANDSEFDDSLGDVQTFDEPDGGMVIRFSESFSKSLGWQAGDILEWCISTDEARCYIQKKE